jgi:hypothetical protein
MTCPKCFRENPDSARFCVRCHMTLRFICPACKHVQTHAGQCDRCGVDFQKYAVMMQFEMESSLRSDRERTRARSAILRHLLLFPLTGGYSLLKSMKSMFARD